MILFRFRQLALSTVLLVLATTTSAQWSDDFGSGALMNWSGDTADYIVNGDSQLQLNASDAGESLIFRSSTISADTISIGFYHLLDFSPSNNNQSRIYLTLDSDDITTANGYYIEIGENGSDDGLDFYYLNSGSEELIASASMGALSTEPAVVRVLINVYPDGLWSINTDYAGDASPALDLEFVDDRFKFSQGLFFGLFCKYSASRADKFFFDDFFVKAFEADKDGPIITNAEVASANTLNITFNEPVESSSALSTSNYQVDNQLGNPASISSTSNNNYTLEFGQNFDASAQYQLTVSGVSDESGNVMEQPFQYSFFFAADPEVGDLQLSEILFDPFPEGKDFVEIYNSSEKNLQLQGLAIKNEQREEVKVIDQSIIVPAMSYLALSEDDDQLLQQYKPDPDANIVLIDLPSFNNDEGNVTLISQNGTTLDVFDYNEDMHFQLIDDTEGVSLERVRFDIESNAPQNWRSASENSRFATPGYANSASITVNPSGEMFDLVSETFSPNQDGQDDIMILSYSLDKPNYVANISIYDAAGFKIKELSSNELLGSEGILVWDGTNSDGNIADLGIYIIVAQLFHVDGDVINFKKTTVLADFID